MCISQDVKWNFVFLLSKRDFEEVFGVTVSVGVSFVPLNCNCVNCSEAYGWGTCTTRGTVHLYVFTLSM